MWVLLHLHKVAFSPFFLFGCVQFLLWYSNNQKIKILILLIIWISENIVRPNERRVSKKKIIKQSNESLSLIFFYPLICFWSFNFSIVLIILIFWFSNFLIKSYIFEGQWKTDKGCQDVRLHDNNSISYFVLIPQYMKKNKDD